MGEEARTPLERAQRAIEKWNYHWAKSQASNILLMNIKQEIEGAIRDAYERGAVLAEDIGDKEHEKACDPQEDNSDHAGEKIAAAIRALKGEG